MLAGCSCAESSTPGQLATACISVPDGHVRLCCSSWTNKLIPAKDHGSIQINIGHLDEEGVYKTGQYTTFALHGSVRATVRISGQCSSSLGTGGKTLLR